MTRRFGVMICPCKQRIRMTASAFPRWLVRFLKCRGGAVTVGGTSLPKRPNNRANKRALTRRARPIIVRAMYGFRTVFGICRGIIS
jgi:hypothetical protein